MEPFQDWLNQLDQELNLGGALVLDEHQRCFLMFDETLLVGIAYHPADKACIFKGNLGPIDRLPKKQIHSKLLEANLLQKVNGSARFALEQYSEKALLIQSLLMDTCDYSLFNKSLETFVNCFEYWLKNLPSLTSPAISAKKIVGLRV